MDERSEQVKTVVADVPADQWSARLRAHLAEIRVQVPQPRGSDDRDDDGGAGVPACC
ncbi:MAG: hypothetical protein ACJ73S_15460 [Mycobacteriales bacterium]